MKNVNAVSTKIILMLLLLFISNRAQIPKEYNLKFTKLAVSWDEAIPLGNGMLGALIWSKNGKLRFSLDRADLWDLRPMENIGIPEWRYKWVYAQWKNNNYKAVQDSFDLPYDKNPAPSKIPAGALEFSVEKFGPVASVELKIENALCEVKWKSGAKLITFIDAKENVGWFKFENTPSKPLPEIIKPAYNLEGVSKEENPVTGQDLRRLEYTPGEIEKNANRILYKQKGWGGFEYIISVEWKELKNGLEGCWSISSYFPDWEKSEKASKITRDAMLKGMEAYSLSNSNWWKAYWNKSSIAIPDKVLEKQWYLELYKFGAVARNNTPPISLQAVWTADNGKLPPWKGDFHNDLNTQLSYWHSYTSNHLNLEEGFINWMLKNKNTFKDYTKKYFEAEGINVPGVSTLTGKPMGGWIQYAFSPTVSAWLSQNFYLHWRYTMDRKFLIEKAYPWIKDVALFLEQISIKDKNGKRELLISSSPEFNDNSKEAWFGKTTNFDLALIRWIYEKASELALELKRNDDVEKWKSILSEWGSYDLDERGGLRIANELDYNESHRHFSHLLAIHPLGNIDYSNSEKDKKIIENSINTLDKYGSDNWVGYSFSWLGNLKARMFDGKGAAKALKIFAENFCLPNSFHVNGDQSSNGYSKHRYRPFTLEGNFSFASGIQEMLIQSHSGIVKLFPAIPDEWQDVSFNKLRTEGAFLISAEMKQGNMKSVTVQSEKGGRIKIEFSIKNRTEKKSVQLDMKPGELKSIQLSNQ